VYQFSQSLTFDTSDNAHFTEHLSGIQLAILQREIKLKEDDCTKPMFGNRLALRHDNHHDESVGIRSAFHRNSFSWTTPLGSTGCNGTNLHHGKGVVVVAW
jgi:hypothetical protein